MTQAVVTRRDGDVFQARMFWLKAAHLLDDQGKILRVGFESGPRGFDDVWVEYDPERAPQNQFGEPLLVERMQCKWHATPGSYTYEDLTRPAYINATTTSLLQRAYEAHKTDRDAGTRSRLALVTNHHLAPDDPLTPLFRMKAFTLNIDELFSGTTPRSATFRVRQTWLEHLNIDEDELRTLCISLSLNHTSESLEMLRDRLDDACRLNGLKRPEPKASSTIYDSNIFEWVGQRRMVFDRKEFRDKCEQEGLLVTPAKKVVAYGVKSFEHQFDRLEDRCKDVLNLVSEFEERFIRDVEAWRTTLLPQLRKFLSSAPIFDGRLRLVLDTHATLAFAAGAVLDTKSGRIVEIEQRSPMPKFWAPDDHPLSPGWDNWEFAEIELDASGQGTACAVCITRNAEPMVKQYAQQNLPGLRRLLVAKPQGGASQSVVVCGAHANMLAESFAERIKHDREANPELLFERMHIFIAGPNAFTFYLGRHVQVLKPITLYEFDFDRQRDGSYQPSLSFPDIGNTGVTPTTKDTYNRPSLN